MTAKQQVTSLALTDEDRRQIEKAKKILATKGMKVTLADAIKAALYFFVEQKEAEKSVKQPTQK